MSNSPTLSASASSLELLRARLAAILVRALRHGCLAGTIMYAAIVKAGSIILSAAQGLCSSSPVAFMTVLQLQDLFAWRAPGRQFTLGIPPGALHVQPLQFVSVIIRANMQ